MKNKYAKTNWRDLLPSVFSWLDRVTVEKHKGAQTDALYVVPFETRQDKSAQFYCGCSAKSLQTKIETALKNRMVKEASTGVYTIDSGAVALVSISDLNVAKSQKGRELGLIAAPLLKGLTSDHLVVFEGGGVSAFDIFDGVVQAWYALESFREKQVDQNFPSKVSLCAKNFSEERVAELKALMKATILSRMVADAPPNWMDSEKFAEIAKDISKELRLKCTVWGREKLLKNGMSSFYSVAQGTYIDPKFIAIEIPGEDTSKWAALVGKGLTFDSGGISLKPGLGMHEMKYDMCGGAAVLGASYFLGHVKPAVNTVCLIGAVENMPGRYATRPGDIVGSYLGKTIEIQNTDAEGRLVLVDLLGYAVKNYNLEFVVDVATLTGAVLFGLGTVGAAIMSNKPELVKYLKDCSTEQGEPLWELPLWPELDKELKSDFADLKNITNPLVKAGSITAGVFLKQFVEETPWAHLDIAGTGWDCQATGFPKKGACAFSLRTLVKACTDWKG